MACHPIEFGTLVQPHSVERRCYRIRMQPKDPKDYLWTVLVRRLGMPEESGVDAVFKALKSAKVSRGTVQRIRQKNTSIGTDNLVKLAAHFRVQVWELLKPADQKQGQDDATPPAPSPGFEDRRTLKPEDWELWQAFSIGATKEQRAAIVERYESIKLAAQELQDAIRKGEKP